MKDPIHSLRRWLHALIGVNIALLCALCLAATPAVRPLLLASGTNQPTTRLNLSGPNVTGDPTSGKAINPASIGATTPGSAQFSVVSTLVLGVSGTSNFYNDATFNGYNLRDVGRLTLDTLTASGTISFDGGAGYSDGSGDLTANNFFAAQTLASIEVDVNDPFNGEAGGAITYSAVSGFTLGTAGPASNPSGSLTVGGTVRAASLGLFGVNPPANRPATPTTQAGIIAVLQAYGLCQ